MTAEAWPTAGTGQAHVPAEVPTLLDADDSTAPASGPLQPGLVLVFVGARASLTALPVPEDGLELGRTQDTTLGDASISRRHATIRRSDEGWTITDLDSSNGTFVDGVRVHGAITVRTPQVLRLGSAIFLFRDDVAPFAVGVSVREEVVVGPTLLAVLKRIGHLARIGGTLHVTGESGSGKEIMARAFHAASPHANGPFVAVNCAAIPKAIAERLLFGARRGAFSGADTDAEGYVQAAHRGTLFLDEIGELDVTVQAKLLRVLENKEVLALGAVKPVAVDMRLCSATMRSLLAEVEAGRFREDLYYRVGRPAVAMPPLRERLEEIPLLIQREIDRMPARVALTASFVEACLLRPWRGNVRELMQHVREAASMVLDAVPPTLRVEHLPPLHVPPAAAAQPTTRSPAENAGTPEHRAAVQHALESEGRNVSAAARRLGVHRNQLRRWITRYGLDTTGSDPGADL